MMDVLINLMRGLLSQSVCVCVCVCVCTRAQSHQVLANSSRLHGLQPARLLCPWVSPGKKTGVGCHALLQVIFPSQGWNPVPSHCRRILYRLSHQGIIPTPLPNYSVSGYYSYSTSFSCDQYTCRVKVLLNRAILAE